MEEKATDPPGLVLHLAGQWAPSAARGSGHGCCSFSRATGSRGSEVPAGEEALRRLLCVELLPDPSSGPSPHCLLILLPLQGSGRYFPRAHLAQQGGWLSWAAVSAAIPYFSLFLLHFGETRKTSLNPSRCREACLHLAAWRSGQQAVAQWKCVNSSSGQVFDGNAVSL